MKYLQPFLYFARKPKTGPTNLLIGCLCPLVPFMGEMVLLGYRAQVSEELERDPDLKDHPDIKLDDLMIYLQRGIWPFLARLVFTLVSLPILGGLSIGAGLAAYEFSGEAILGFGVGFALLFVLYLLAATILWPMEYHAQMTRTFAPIRELKFALGFARVCWLSTFDAVLMYTMLGGLTMIVGTMLFCIGQYPAAVIVQMAEQHLMSQLYLLYLEEGGEPIRTFAEVEDDVPPRAVRAEDE